MLFSLDVRLLCRLTALPPLVGGLAGSAAGGGSGGVGSLAGAGGGGVGAGGTGVTAGLEVVCFWHMTEWHFRGFSVNIHSTGA